MPKISKHAGPSYEGILEPRHVTYDDDQYVEDSEPREETDGDVEPVTVYESGKNPPELETPAIVPFGEEPVKSTSRKQRDAERRERESQ